MQLNKSCSMKFTSFEEKQPSNFQEEEVDIVALLIVLRGALWPNMEEML